MKKRIHMAEHISNRERERPRRMLALTVASATLDKITESVTN